MGEWMLPKWIFILGLCGQLAFSARFVVQWICSEIKKESYFPMAFWYFSVIGGILMLSYAIVRKDPIFTFGQAMGLCVYLRNIRLIYKKSKRDYQPSTI